MQLLRKDLIQLLLKYFSFLWFVQTEYFSVQKNAGNNNDPCSPSIGVAYEHLDRRYFRLDYWPLTS